MPRGMELPISEDLLKYRSCEAKIGGWPGDAYQLVLHTLALGLQAQVVYEWGVGWSTLALLRAVQRTGGKVVSCDINEKKALFVRDYASDALDQWEFHCLPSEELWTLASEQAELIFIDGCHVYGCVIWEVEHFWPLLKDDGMMVLHDTRDWPDGPGKVFQLLQRGGLEVLEIPFSCGMAVIHKRPSDPRALAAILAQ